MSENKHTPEPSLKYRAEAIGLYDARLIDWVIRVEQLTKQRDELLAACEGVIAWDKSRKFLIPYKVRDPIHAAIASVKGVPINPASLLPDERECCGTFPRTPHRSTCKNYRGKKGGAA